MATFRVRNGRVQAMIRRRGQPFRSATFSTMLEAKRWAEGAHMVKERERIRKDVKGLTLSEALDQYAREISPTKKGEDQELYLIKRWQREPLSSLPLTEITTKQLARWRDNRVYEGMAPSSIRNALYLLSHLFRVVQSEWGMEKLHNPVKGMRMPRSKRPRERRLEPGEEARLLRACDDIHPRLRPLIVFAIETAMRQGELLSLHWWHINGRVALLTETKNGHGRAVPLSKRAREILDQLRREDKPRDRDKVFPFTRFSLSSYWKRVKERAQLDDLHFHDLRHEAISRLFEKGLSAEKVMTISGHRTYSMVRRYTHLRAEDMVDLLD